MTLLLAMAWAGPQPLQPLLDAAAPGAVIELGDSDWQGPVHIDTPLTLRGGHILGTEEGNTVTLTAPGVRLEGVRVSGSGKDLATGDACIRLVPEAVGAVLDGVQAQDCLFGVWVHTTPDAQILNSTFLGIEGGHPSKKGNGIHLFDSTNLLIEGNSVTNHRDGIYVSATDDSLILDNELVGLRYGIHYMYSQRNTVRGNLTQDCSGGIALMQSHHLIIEANHSVGNTKQGILFRDVQYSRIADNVVEDNGEGMFFFSSLDNEIVDNRVVGNDMGMRIWAGTYRNTVAGNAFIGNAQQVFYVASEDQVWEGESGGNYWSDYLGWDQDGDGRGDRPYRVDSLVAGLLQRAPAAVLLLNSPTLELLRQLQNRLPALRQPTIIDAAPRIAPPAAS